MKFRWEYVAIALVIFAAIWIAVHLPNMPG